MTEKMTIDMANDEIMYSLGANNLDTTAEKQVYQDICYKVHMLKFKLGKEVPCKQAKYDEFLALKDELNKNESMNYIGFFTLNFSEGTDLTKIKKVIQKIISKKWLTEYYYCFEQRGETIDDVKGIHVHLLFRRGDKRPAACCSEIFNSYASLQGRKYADVKNHDYKFYPYEYFEDKQNYMIGNKWDKEKEKKVEIDKIWRQANSLQLLYGTDDPFSLGIALTGDLESPQSCHGFCSCGACDTCCASYFVDETLL